MSVYFKHWPMHLQDHNGCNRANLLLLKQMILLAISFSAFFISALLGFTFIQPYELFLKKPTRVISRSLIITFLRSFLDCLWLLLLFIFFLFAFQAFRKVFYRIRFNTIKYVLCPIKLLLNAIINAQYLLTRANSSTFQE